MSIKYKNAYERAWYFWRHRPDIELTKAEWIAWWHGTQQFDNRGNAVGCVRMERIDKELPWTLDNIQLKTRTRGKRHAARI